MTKETVETLRAVVIKQRAKINSICQELETYKTAYNVCKKLYDCEKEINKMQFDYTLKQGKRIESINEQFELKRIFTRFVVAFMVDAINKGYNFSDKKTKNVFSQLCDRVKTNDKVLEKLFTEFKTSK